MNSNPAVVTLGGDTVAIGSRVDFDDFYRAELPLLVALARALCGAAVADDIAQEAMLVAYRRWRPVGDLEHPEGLGTEDLREPGRFAVPAQAGGAADGRPAVEPAAGARSGTC
jgi:Sigma-70 region 2